MYAISKINGITQTSSNAPFFVDILPIAPKILSNILIYTGHPINLCRSKILGFRMTTYWIYSEKFIKTKNNSLSLLE